MRDDPFASLAGPRDFAADEEERAASEVPDVGKFALPIELFGEIRPAVDRRWLVKRLLRASAAAVVFGYPGCGKSFLVLDLGLHVAAGREWFGRRVAEGAVVYIAAEGQGGVRSRIEAWRREHAPATDVPFAVVPAAVDLFDATAGDLAKLNSDLARLRARWGRLDLVIVDTLNATMGAGDENGPDMGVYVGNVRRVCASFDCAWIIVTHVPLNGEAKRPRGHGSLWGAVDTAIHVSGDRDAPARKLSVIKQKDDDPGADILFKLKQVPIGEDEDGDDVTSCVVVQSDLEPAHVHGRKKLSAKEAIVFAALERALISKGVFRPLRYRTTSLAGTSARSPPCPNGVPKPLRHWQPRTPNRTRHDGRSIERERECKPQKSLAFGMTWHGLREPLGHASNNVRTGANCPDGHGHPFKGSVRMSDLLADPMNLHPDTASRAREAA